jgi:hypothetical protein
MEPIITLRDNLAKLSPRDQAFAQSLLASRTLSEKQHHWIAVLAQRATAQPAAPRTVGDITAIVALIDRAKSRLKYPALLIASPAGTLRISVAGPAAREPGSITVVSQDRRNAEGRRMWFGRVTTAGAFEPSNRLGQDAQAVGDALAAFAADPAKAASEYGHRTGFCCFCAKKLDDARSTAVGYGSTCARNWGLAWGAKAAKAVMTCEGEGA